MTEIRLSNATLAALGEWRHWDTRCQQEARNGHEALAGLLDARRVAAQRVCRSLDIDTRAAGHDTGVSDAV